jgi:hypothetical protein
MTGQQVLVPIREEKQELEGSIFLATTQLGIGESERQRRRTSRTAGRGGIGERLAPGGLNEWVEVATHGGGEAVAAEGGGRSVQRADVGKELGGKQQEEEQ